MPVAQRLPPAQCAEPFDGEGRQRIAESVRAGRS
jgi:hypothetical protein